MEKLAILFFVVSIILAAYAQECYQIDPDCYGIRLSYAIAALCFSIAFATID
jgi:hypothetical protein